MKGDIVGEASVNNGWSAALRQRAEARLPTAALAPGAPDDPCLRTHLLLELQVQHIELGMQNEELMESRGRLEAALAEYTELYDFAPVGYFTLGCDGAIRQVNLMGASLLGVERRALLGRPLGFFLSDEEAFAAWLTLLFRRDPDRPCCELEVATRAAAQPIVQLTGAVNARGDECRVILMDVSRQREAEERLRDAQKMEALGHLAGGVAHDFNNLLTVMLSHTDFALASAPADPHLAEDLMDIKIAAQRAAALTRQLLTFASKQVSRPRIIAVNAVVRETMSLLRRTLGDHIELVLRLSPNLGHVSIDPVQLEQVIVNVAINARDAMPRGGKLTIATFNEDRDGRRVCLRMTDSGAGMSPATQQRIFDPFFTTKGLCGGSGLGLSTVHGIMKQCGGETTVYSEPGRGSTFTFHFPLVEAPLWTAGPAAPAASRTGRGETILIVDDDPLVRRAAVRILSPGGYRLLDAGNGVEALGVCQQHQGPIDLVLSDLIMPKMTGLELVAHLQRLRAEARVLFMSGYAGHEGAQGSLMNPETPLLGKPFDAEALRSKVRELLDAPRTPPAALVAPLPARRHPQ